MRSLCCVTTYRQRAVTRLASFEEIVLYTGWDAIVRLLICPRRLQCKVCHKLLEILQCLLRLP